jgi:RNA polymerase sigma-70 factor (ECF subfamily)
MTDEAPQVTTLLSRLRQGEAEALAALFEECQPRLRLMLQLRMDPRLATRLGLSDVLQEVYMDAARQVQAYLNNPRVAFYVWLRGLAWERLLKLQRRHLGAACRAVGRERPLPAESSEGLARQLAVRGLSPSQTLVQEELRRRVQAALEQLKPEDQEVILLRDFEDLSNGEVAQALGLSDSAATMRYGRALYRLKEVLTAGLAEGESRP